MSATRIMGWLIAALFGGGAAILANQYFLAENTSVEPVDADEMLVLDDAGVAVSALPALARPDAARRVVIEGLTDLGLSSQAIRQGLYPLRGAGRNTSDTMPLISFDCPVDHDCTGVMSTLERKLATAGMELVSSTTPERRGRPIFRAVVSDGRPALALRAFPPGGRIAVIIADVGLEPAILDSVYGLDSDVTYAVSADSPHAADVAKRLQELGREYIAHLPMEPNEGTTPGDGGVLSMSMTPGQISEKTRAYMDLLAGAAGADGHRGGKLSASSKHMTAVLEVLAENGRYFFDQRPSDASVGTALAKALGVRSATRTHRIETSGSLDAQLQAVRVALVLEGEVVVVVQPEPDVIDALKPWLAELRKRKFNVMRLSEIVL